MTYTVNRDNRRQELFTRLFRDLEFRRDGKPMGELLECHPGPKQKCFLKPTSGIGTQIKRPNKREEPYAVSSWFAQK